MNENLTRQIREEEGEVLHAYMDSEGYWTIGIGILIDRRKGGGITQDESRYLFLNRLQSKMSTLSILLPYFGTLNDARQGVLIGMAYQMGIDGLLNFKDMLAALVKNDYETAAKEMLDSKWAKQTPDRARRLSKQMQTGQWQFQ